MEKKKDLTIHVGYPLLVKLIWSAGVAIVTLILGIIGIKKVDPSYVYHDVMTYDNISSMIETYFVDTGLMDSSILELKSPLEQMEMLHDQLQNEQAAQSEFDVQLKRILISAGCDSSTINELEGEEVTNYLSTYLTDITEENVNLVSQYEELNQKYIKLSTEEEQSDVPNITDVDPVSTPVQEVASVFDMTPVNWRAFCFDRSSSSINEEDLTDSYGNEYLSAHIAYHGSGTTKDSASTPEYVLDGKYEKCVGQIVLSRSNIEMEGKIWIEFYSGEQLIYKTDEISMTDKVLDFSFSIEGINEFSIVTAGTNSRSAKVIYPYLNLMTIVK